MSNDATQVVEQLSLNLGNPSESTVEADDSVAERRLVPFVDLRTQLLRQEAIERVRKAGIFRVGHRR